MQASQRLRENPVLEQLHALEQKLTQQHEEHLQVCTHGRTSAMSAFIRMPWQACIRLLLLLSLAYEHCWQQCSTVHDC